MADTALLEPAKRFERYSKDTGIQFGDRHLHEFSAVKLYLSIYLRNDVGYSSQGFSEFFDQRFMVDGDLCERLRSFRFQGQTSTFIQ